jgi:molybdopterin-guanine dinucleotide biosynthesis protein
MKLVMIGGHSRNIGKSSVVEGLIRALPEFNWTAAKITQFGHGICSMNGKACGCAVSEHQFSITEERHRDTGTDTARFLAAGAQRSLWVRTKQGELLTALPTFQKKIQGDQFVIVESNSLRRFMNPAVYLQVLDVSNPDFKVSAREFFDLSDAYVLVRTGGDQPAVLANSVLLEREIQKNKPCFTVTREHRFISGEIVEFVRSKLELRESDVARCV